MTAIKIARIYITESDKLLNSIMNYLHNETKIKGVTVFRGMSGFGKSGAIHSDTSACSVHDLPIVVEFFDAPDKVEHALSYLKTLAHEGHVVSWDAINE